MKNKLWIPIIALLLFTSVDSFGQRWKLRRYELDMYVAGVAFHGDIGLANQPLANMINGFRPSFGLNPRFMITNKMAVSMDLGYYMYGGKDEPGSSHGRYYSFTSHALVHGFRGEYYIMGTRENVFAPGIYNRRGMVNAYNRLFLYMYGGASGILSKSYVKDLNNDGEEPVNNPGYNNNAVYSLVFPVGAGVKFEIDPRWSMGFELGYSFSLSDQIDGYASEWSEYNDSYYTASVKAIYKIRNDKNGRPILQKLYR
ncbi:MAG: hypothetical protein P1P86_14700 [Bacteroidales bacterium]|nr:hypothetical protein [Bacteroidales bacterium]